MEQWKNDEISTEQIEDSSNLHHKREQNACQEIIYNKSKPEALMQISLTTI